MVDHRDRHRHHRRLYSLFEAIGQIHIFLRLSPLSITEKGLEASERLSVIYTSINYALQSQDAYLLSKSQGYRS